MAVMKRMCGCVGSVVVMAAFDVRPMFLAVMWCISKKMMLRVSGGLFIL